MSEILEYKCPSCGGAIAFDSTLQKMKCPFCETEFEVETLKSYDEVLKKPATDNLHWKPYGADSGSGDWRQGEQQGLYTYSCTSCGAEIVGDETLAATSCPYCQNPVVMQRQFAGSLRPDAVIPFKLDKDAAKAALRAHFKGKWLLPKAFKTEAKLDELKGVYVPFWLFDCDADASVRYKATRTSTWSDSRNIYTKTDFFLVLREGAVGFVRVPVDGSQKADDAYMEALEPYDYGQLVDFQTAYLAGYLADKYDVDADQSAVRAGERVKNSVVEVFASTVQGYATVLPENTSVHLTQGNVSYVLLPVWMLNTRYRDKLYAFAMNGQTGKLVGNLPLDRGKFWGFFAGIFAAVAAIGTALVLLLY